MSKQKTGSVLLVGSVPFDNAESVFNTCSHTFGERLFAIPDGEIGDRAPWIMGLPHMAYVGHEDLEPIRIVSKALANTSPKSHAPEDMRATRATFKIKDGVKDLAFNLPYAAEAIKAYPSFRRRKEKGEIPQHVRFQVSFPTTHAGTSGFFPDKEDETVARKAYNDSIRNGIKQILAEIPASELVIQWDYCTELLDIIGARDPYITGPLEPHGVRFEKYTSTEYLAPMTDILPKDVLLGYHLCYGTWGGWPIGQVKDLEFCVRLANALIENTPRRVDYVHLPAMPGADEAFFKPLTGLKHSAVKIFLGLELADGVDALNKRIDHAKKYLNDFGISHYCGYGREEQEKVRKLMDDLRAGADHLAKS